MNDAQARSHFVSLSCGSIAVRQPRWAVEGGRPWTRKMFERRSGLAAAADRVAHFPPGPWSLPPQDARNTHMNQINARVVNRLSSRLCRKKSKEKIEPDFNRSFSPFLSPPWPRSIAHKRLASMDSGYNQRHDFLSFNHFPEPVGEGEMEEEIVCNRWRDLAGEQIFGQLVRPKDCSPSRLSEEMSVVWASHSAQGHFFPSNDQPPTTFSFFLLAVRSLLGCSPSHCSSFHVGEQQPLGTSRAPFLFTQKEMEKELETDS